MTQGNDAPGEPEPFLSQNPELDWAAMEDRAVSGLIGNEAAGEKKAEFRLRTFIRRLRLLEQMEALPHAVDGEGNEIVQINGVWLPEAFVRPKVLAGEFRLPEAETGEDEIGFRALRYLERMRDLRPPVIIALDAENERQLYIQAMVKTLDSKLGRLTSQPDHDDDETFLTKQAASDAAKATLKAREAAISYPETALEGFGKYPVVIREITMEDDDKDYIWLGCHSQEHAEAYIEAMGGDIYVLRMPDVGKSTDARYGWEAARLANALIFTRRIYINPYFKPVA